MSGVKAIPLICPDCGRRLAGLRYDRIFFCMSCSRGLEPGQADDWVRFPLSYAAIPNPPRASMLYLPFWQLKIHTATLPTNRQQEVACRLLDNLHSVWVMAFTVIRPSYFGDTGLLFTEKKVEVKKTGAFPAGYYVAGCTRTLEDAIRYANLFVTLILDKRADVTGLELDIKTSDAGLWAMPFADYGGKLMELHTGSEIPAFAVDDLEDIRRINRKKPGGNSRT